MKQFGNSIDDYYDSPVKEYPFLSRLLFRVAVCVVYVFSKLYWRWTTEGPHGFRGVPNDAPGRVIVANHGSMFDPVVLILDATFNGRTLRPLYKSELDKVGLVNWFFSRVGGIPIKRGTADMKAIRRAVASLKRGEDICIFPEGTRTRDPQARPPLHGGFAIIAQMAKADVVPIAIDGSDEICPSGKGFSRPAKVRLRYGAPLSFDDVPGAGRREKADAMEAAAMARVYELRNELRLAHGKPSSLPAASERLATPAAPVDADALTAPATSADADTLVDGAVQGGDAR